jgi:hypothetical protein
MAETRSKHLGLLTDQFRVGFEVFTAVAMKNVVFWDVTPRGFIINRLLGGICRLHLQGRGNDASGC